MKGRTWTAVLIATLLPAILLALFSEPAAGEDRIPDERSLASFLCGTDVRAAFFDNRYGDGLPAAGRTEMAETGMRNAPALSISAAKRAGTVENTALSVPGPASGEGGSSLLETVETDSIPWVSLNVVPAGWMIAIILILVGLIVLLAAATCWYVRKLRAINKASEQAKEAVERTNKLLIIDELTGVLNKKGFELSVSASLEKYPDRFWVILDFDVDRFEHFNALYGFKKGDEILRSIAKNALKCCSRDGEVCARIYADHYACLMTGADIDEIKGRVEIQNETYKCAEPGKYIMLSYGIYEIKDRSIPVSIMCDRALAAKRTVKEDYRNLIAVYDEKLHFQQIEDSELIASMDSGIRNMEFVAYYQPKYDIRTEKIVGAEVLVRWKHPKGEISPPSRFISLFERNGLIRRLDTYMLDAACRKLRAQMDAGIAAMPLSINFSHSHLYDERFLVKLVAIVRKYRIPPGLVEVELTETSFLEFSDRLPSVIDELHRCGFSISVDDFGSGFSSLNMLKDLDFDVLKLDRGFLSATASSERSRTVIRYILLMARELDLVTVAEGVETKEQLEFLRENKCDIAQGFYFSKPLPEDEYDALLGEQKQDRVLP